MRNLFFNVGALLCIISLLGTLRDGRQGCVLAGGPMTGPKTRPVRSAPPVRPPPPPPTPRPRITPPPKRPRDNYKAPNGQTHSGGRSRSRHKYKAPNGQTHSGGRSRSPEDPEKRKRRLERVSRIM
ncbi:acrosin-like [Rhipicephalus sanguineus]|uniref:acrosin-like n=1 Tax=Rhipicephalus sanguineus TaxID=34632 RepID=UPI0020C297A4|nr:acrosin-like [Rhipicephalus sanguineus]